ncbi:hypothetical protein PUW24_16215 [Paenibacillus urinalis]|uniref:Uncharacterized protein n=1 Tax=Paenibacillus urinalis TaxID=521520 RepID=A0ABY7XHD2_9BACL|nr:hypothetical protein [Paenibacillus urinalis]WDH95745.1 hypothetical protein PUW24_16215 [Paenibacillus urinalis]WDI03942.1 hypothetical protein PUW25_08335 [Paenibacillus urinalis]
MDEFSKRLSEASAALILLSKEFERLETDHSDLLCLNYPFSVCLLEIVHGMLEWQETINELKEAIKLGKTANS